MNKKAIMEEDDYLINKNRLMWGLRQIFIVFSGSISIVSLVIFSGFLIRMYFDSLIMYNRVGLSEGFIYGYLFIAIISLLWSIQAIIWFYKNRYQW